MLKILIQMLVLVIIIAIVSNDQLRFQATNLGGDAFEFTKQAIIFVFERGNDFLKGKNG